ncbi:MAG: hypothetical protein IPJ62_05235 [Betaproteobacteria bacterium]|nr:hypothetical protein [Betaproteobacteria bacterium]
MNRLLVSMGSVLWWLVPLALIVTAIGWETDWGRHLRPELQPVEPVTPKPVSIAVLPDFALEGGLAARTETTNRTLFNPTRRPAPPPVAEAPKPTIKRGQFVLTGTLVVDGKSTAFLREVAGGKSRRVLQGQSINGLLVAEVKPDRVKLTMGDETEDLVLKVQPNPRPTAVATAPPAAPGAAPPPRLRVRCRHPRRRSHRRAARPGPVSRWPSDGARRGRHKPRKRHRQHRQHRLHRPRKRRRVERPRPRPRRRPTRAGARSTSATNNATRRRESSPEFKQHGRRQAGCPPWSCDDGSTKNRPVAAVTGCNE